MQTDDFYGGRRQDWASSFDLSDARHSTFELLSQGVLRIGDVETSVDLECLPWTYSDDAHPSWRLRFLSLKWLCPSIFWCDRVGRAQDIQSHVDLISQVIADWIRWEKGASDDEKTDHWNGHTVALRATTLASASSFIFTDWLRESLHDHAAWLADETNWDGPWNHGFMQSIALMCVALRLDDKPSTALAIDRIHRSIDAMIDEQGCINEQAPAYARFIYNLLGQLRKVCSENGIADSEFRIDERQKLLIKFMAHATDPSGTFAQLGDSLKTAPMNVPGTELEYVLTNGREGRAPESTVAVYDQGFIFGRSGWGTETAPADESFYSIRFGPARVIHGHNDHMSVTLFDDGRDVLIDSGHNGYRDDRFRRHLRSVEAHNVLTVRGMRHDWSALTSLARSEISKHSQFFELRDEAYSQITRSRSILAGPKAPMVVLDRTISSDVPRTYDQLWHVSPAHELVSSDNGHVFFKTTDGASGTQLVSYVVDEDNSVAHPTSSYWRGSQEPHQGWYSGRDQENVPAPAVSFSAKASNLFMVTCVYAGEMGVPAGHSLRLDATGWLILRLHTRSGSWAWRISRGGYLALRSRPE